jgi:hypothetical protein
MVVAGMGALCRDLTLGVPAAMLWLRSVYEAPDMAMLDKRSVKLDNVQVRVGGGVWAA